MLKCFFKMGVKVTKLPRVIKIKQGYICKDYIEIDTKNNYS